MIETSRTGILLILAAAALWGTLGVAFRGLDALGATPVAVGLWRAAVAWLVIGILLLLRARSYFRMARRDIPLFAGYGLISVALFFVVYTLAVDLSTVAVAAVLLYTAPAFVTLLAALFFREPFTPRKAITLILTFFGVVLIAGITSPAALTSNWAGLLAGLGAGFTYATFSIFGKAALQRYHPTTAIYYALTFGLLCLLPVVAAWPAERVGFLAPLQSWQGVLLVLYVGVIPTAGSFWLYTAGLARLNDAGRASVLATLEPLVATMLGYLILGEGLSLIQIIGGLLILLGIGISANPE